MQPGVPKPNTNVFDRDGEFNFPIVLAAPAIAGLVFLGQSLLGASDIPLVNAIVFEAFALVLLAGMIPIILDQRREDAFRAWLFEHETELAGDGADYHGVRLRADTELVRLHYVWSMLLISLRARGRPLVAGVDDVDRVRRSYALISSILGWWFWRGPITTIQALRFNRRGGQSLTIAAYIHELRNPTDVEWGL